MPKIDFLNLKLPYVELKEEIDLAIQRVLDSGWYILGEEVESFEANWSRYCESKYCLGVASGLDALVLALKSLGIGDGDEVIVPSNTYIATWLAINSVGAKIIPVEPDINTYNLNPDLIEESITENTKAIMPVHLYGQPADLNPIIKIAKENNLKIIEDAAQSHGAKYNNQKIGSHGDIVCWSFYPGKNLGAFGDGGAITTDSKKLYQKIKLLRNYGSSRKYFNSEKGINSRLDPLQAAVLNVKLKYLDEWNNRRSLISYHYLNNIDNKNLILPEILDNAYSCWHQFVIRSKNREDLINYLNSKGVSTLIHYPIPPHQQEAFSEIDFSFFSLKIAETLSNEVLSIPIGPHLKETDYKIVANLLSNNVDI